MQRVWFFTMLPSGDLLNFGNTGNNNLPLAILVSISVLGYYLAHMFITSLICHYLRFK